MIPARRVFVLLGIVVLIICFVFYRSGFRHASRNSSQPPVESQTAPQDFKSTDDLMRYLASQAVNDAKNEGQVTLDYSTGSLKSVDGILNHIHEEYSRNKSAMAVDGLAMAYGAYIGEVIRRKEPTAKWERDHPVGGPRSYPLTWSAGDSFPCAWAYRQILNGEEDSIWVKYSVLANRDTGGTVITRQTVRTEPSAH